MESGDWKFIWQVPDWPVWQYDSRLASPLAEVCRAQGLLLGRLADTPLNPRQIKLLNRLLDGFEGKLTNRKWAAIAKCSPDTAPRDINEPIALGVLRKTDAGVSALFRHFRSSISCRYRSLYVSHA
ncbi:MAG: DUF4172 domain-containing protein [Methylococcus sp.]|nr:DUF4172 domain-containing protein [Methylococcus sp.]